MQVEFVDKINLEAQNPRRNTSIPSVSTGLGQGGGLLGHFGLVVHMRHLDMLDVWDILDIY